MYLNRESRSNTAQKNSQIMLLYLLTSNYMHYLRNTFPHFLCLQEDEKLMLVRNAQLFRVKEDHTTMVINYNQPTLSIVVYGEVRIDKKIYAKGTHFLTEMSKVEMQFTKKSLIMMLNQREIEDIMQQYERYYTNKDILERILPVESLKLEKKQYKILCNQVHVVQNNSKGPFSLAFSDREGIYLFYQGTYVLLNKDKTKIIQLFNDYFGEECLWEGYSHFHVKPLTFNHKYMWLSKDILQSVFSQEAIENMRQIYEKKLKQRQKLEKECNETLKNVQQIVKGKKESLILKKFSPVQKQEFSKTLDLMSKNLTKPKWKREQQSEWEQRTKKKRFMTPKRKTKSTYFSTLSKNQTLETDYQNVFHRKEYSPFSMKMHLEQRVPSKIQYLRRTKTLQDQYVAPKHPEKIGEATSFSYYSHNYDRSYSMGMTNLSKMRKYDELKKSSTLKKGEKIMSTQELSDALSVSFGQLSSVLACKNQKYRANPQQLFQKTIKRNKLLAKRIMEKKGATTWR